MSERIPGTNPKWNRNLPDGSVNSLVDEYGNSYDNGFNFDEKDDEDGWDEVADMADKDL
jgi:hypothetical protein